MFRGGKAIDEPCGCKFGEVGEIYFAVLVDVAAKPVVAFLAYIAHPAGIALTLVGPDTFTVSGADAGGIHVYPIALAAGALVAEFAGPVGVACALVGPYAHSVGGANIRIVNAHAVAFPSGAIVSGPAGFALAVILLYAYPVPGAY
jgi:hypothetical protein